MNTSKSTANRVSLDMKNRGILLDASISFLSEKGYTPEKEFWFPRYSARHKKDLTAHLRREYYLSKTNASFITNMAIRKMRADYHVRRFAESENIMRLV